MLPCASLIRVMLPLPRAEAIRVLRPAPGEDLATSLEVKSQLAYQVKMKLDDQQPTAAVDLDGTLTIPHPHWPKVDIDEVEVRPGAAEGMQRLQAAGWRLIIFTMHDDLDGVADWLDDHDIPYHYINENPDQDSDSPKVQAHLYIDDRALNADKPWPKIVQEVLDSGDAPEPKSKHLIVTGHSGSGKSTLAKVLGERLSLPVWKVDLDPLWQENKELADHPNRYTQGTKEAKQFRKLLKKLVRRAVSKEEPHILEGCQFLAATGTLRGHKVLVIGGDEDDITQQRLRRDFEDGKLQRDGTDKRIQKAVDLYKKLQPDVKRLQSRSGVESISPHESEEWARNYVFEQTVHALTQAGEDIEVAKTHAAELANFQLYDHTKAMSAYDSTSGGALVAPPQQGSFHARRKCLKCGRYLVQSKMGWGCPDPSCNWSLFAAGDETVKAFRYRRKGWVTIGGSPASHDGHSEQHHGGTPVFIGEGGTIEKGPKKLQGKKPSQLKPPAPPPSQIQQPKRQPVSPPKAKKTLAEQTGIDPKKFDSADKFAYEVLSQTDDKFKASGQELTEALAEKIYNKAVHEWKAANKSGQPAVAEQPKAPPKATSNLGELPKPTKYSPLEPEYYTSQANAPAAQSAESQAKPASPTGKKVVQLAFTKPPASLVQHAKEQMGKLTDDQKKAIRSYTGSGYADLNVQMRNCAADLDCLDDENKILLANIESALAKVKPFPEPVDVYRGVGLYGEQAQMLLDDATKYLKSGGSYTMPSVTSTSINPGLAATGFGSGNGVVFKIKARKGLYLGAGLSKFDNEQEVLQSAASRYKVTDIADTDFVSPGGNSNKRKTIYLEEVL